MKEKRYLTMLVEIQANPERHFQGHWTSISTITPKIKEEEGQVINCGTTGCLAGLAAFRYAPVGTEFYGDVLVLPGKVGAVKYSTYGAEVLGLDEYEREYLFSGSRSVQQLMDYGLMTPEKRTKFINEYFAGNSVVEDDE